MGKIKSILFYSCDDGFMCEDILIFIKVFLENFLRILCFSFIYKEFTGLLLFLVIFIYIYFRYRYRYIDFR